jgi:GPH family glycoside/pentoside/hexuronide:cation symporter
MPFIGKLVSKFGKKECVAAGFIVTIVAYALMLVLPITPDGKGLMLYAACQAIAALGNGPATCVGWSLVADFIDYGEWKTGDRDEGTNYALYSFFRKLAQGIGPSLGLVLATLLGYNAALGANQPAEVALTMRYMVAYGYLIGQTVQLLAIGLVYNLDKKTLAKIHTDLAARKAAN